MEVPRLKLTLKFGSVGSAGSVGSGTPSGKATPAPLSGKATPTPPTARPPAPAPQPNNQQNNQQNTQKKPTKVVKRRLNDGFRPRRYRLIPVQLSTITGYTLTLPAWSTDRHAKEVEPHAPATSTFVCPREGCHKIFDSKPKWRRHQAAAHSVQH